jgi:hypothetical protein
MARSKVNFDVLKKAQTRLNKNSDFRKLGSTDVKLAIAVGDEARLVTFEAFEVSSIETLSVKDMRDAELILTMSLRNWNAYLKKCKRGQGPSLLSLDVQDNVISAVTPLAKLKLARYNKSLQAFIDACARYAA